MTTQPSDPCSCEQSQALIAELARRDQHLSRVRVALQNIALEAARALAPQDAGRILHPARAACPGGETPETTLVINGVRVCRGCGFEAHGAPQGEPAPLTQAALTAIINRPGDGDAREQAATPEPPAVVGEPKCPTCGYVMCEQFDERRLNDVATLATPNGKFTCYHCRPLGAPTPTPEAAPARTHADLQALVDGYVSATDLFKAQVAALTAERDKYRDVARLALLQRDALKGDLETSRKVAESFSAQAAQLGRDLLARTGERDSLAGELREAREADPSVEEASRLLWEAIDGKRDALKACADAVTHLKDARAALSAPGGKP